MKNLINFCKTLQIRQILTIFLAGILLIVSTACSGVDAQGANPKNTPVQAGGANNPYKSGNDKYTNLRMSTDPKVTTEANKQKNDQASVPVNLQILLASTQESKILYPGAETPAGRVKKEAELPLITEEEFKHPEPGGLIQREPDVKTRIQERIETVTESVEKASGFLKEKGDEAGARPELQKNPVVGK
ncbi:hypothetical protein A0J48_001490 [Sphaerospermopsis aphanizomenoides BCCUSP55]|uniref:DUF6658 family protein n=1 Tax=Sphaerospermopsis aphanizomenoides TaxID=459663 RepID=UPI000A698F4C|nr:DUF6658 family protein [Sphaerospermopsis aphanizomenoides]MBK1986235.1 hypothetical protein [Sphaerospermopsis aphanizomenoides BCCUSP55]